MQVIQYRGDDVYYYDPHKPITASELCTFIKIYFHNGFSEDGCIYFKNMIAILTSCNPDEYALDE